MMGYRIGSQMLIAAEEWRAEAEDGMGPSYANLNLDVCGVDGHDEDYGGWCIQSYLPYVSKAPGFEVAAKFMATTAPGRHVMVVSFGSLSEANNCRANAPNDDWSTRVCGYQKHNTGAPLTLQCIWPAR